MADPTTLTLQKVWDGVNWVIDLLWNSGDGPFTVSYSPDPSFQDGVLTLEQDTSATSRSVTADPNRALQCFDVAGQTPISAGVQGVGYDPKPFPTVSSVSGSSLWWGDTVTFTGAYMDAIAKSNVAYMMDTPVRASSPDTSGTYTTSADFTVPDDARGFWGLVQSHGRSSDYGPAPYVPLYAKGIGPFSNIYGIAYVPTNGHFWLAADGAIKEMDIFQHDPGTACGTCTTISGLTKPYISRATSESTPRVLYVDGTLGVTKVYAVNAAGGSPVEYASTHDTGFTANIRPVGIAVDPDGSACYIADGNGGRVVKIPAGAGSGSTIINNWGNKAFTFPDPCGIDVNVGHQVAVAHTNGYIYYIYGQYSWTYYGYAGGLVHSLHFDKDYANTSDTFLFWSNELAMAEAFNQNAIGANPSPRYHGGIVFGLSSGYVALDPDWNFYVYRHFPQRVILNNGGQSQSYPTSYQSADRIIEMQMTGWAGRKVQLRVIDPPDLSPYVPDGGCLQGGCTQALPYEGNDNIGTTDYGISTNPDGSGAQVNGTYPIGNDGTLTFYLKVPARYSGDNFQVEATKCDYAGTTVLSNRVVSLSPVYTSWKRVYVERDRMFRRGGLLDPDKGSFPSNYALPDDQIALDLTNQNLYCTAGTPPCPCTSLPCPSANIPITVFDAAHPYGSGTDQSRTITLLESYTLDGKPVLRATLDAGLDRMGATPAAPLYIAGFTNPATQKCAGVGSVSGCDSDPNQINASNSCFYDADMRNIEQPFDDACVEFIGQRSGMGAVPYLPKSWFDAVGSGMASFSQIWFGNFISAGGGPPPLAQPHNYFHLIGSSSRTDTDGLSNSGYDSSYVFVQNISDLENPLDQTTNNICSTTNHEFGQEFLVNPSVCDGLDSRQAWCGGEVDSSCGTEKCLMNPDRIRIDATDRFCTQDLLRGEPGNGNVHCGDPAPGGLDRIWSQGDGAIRTRVDPQ